MDFFNDCKTEHEVKALFRRLSKLFHPDIGGENEMMIELKKQYDAWKPKSLWDDYQPSPQTKTEVFGASYSYNPRVEILEREIRQLKAQLKESPSTIDFLRSNINARDKIIQTLKHEIEKHNFEFISLRAAFDLVNNENITLNKKISELEKSTIVPEETTDTLWDKIKYVMGNKSKKAYK